jgi:hypothetical protein
VLDSRLRGNDEVLFINMLPFESQQALGGQGKKPEVRAI